MCSITLLIEILFVQQPITIPIQIKSNQSSTNSSPFRSNYSIKRRSILNNPPHERNAHLVSPFPCFSNRDISQRIIPFTSN